MSPERKKNDPKSPVDPTAWPERERKTVAVHLDRIFGEIGELRSLFERSAGVEGQKALWDGVEAIQSAISKTRGEIEFLHSKAVHDRQFNRATDELDAVVSDTESATETILTSAESIDEIASELMQKLDGESKESASQIHQQAIRIFEACNFQDITGQRIGKVVQLLQFIETRVGSMLEIWEGIEGFSQSDVPQPAERVGDEALLNGPALASDSNVVSQDDIDSLFG